MLNQSIETQLQQQVLEAIEQKSQLQIVGGHSKSFYGYESEGDLLDISQHQGITQYDPGELVITCRAGSRVVDIQKALAEHNQMLAFEPPLFSQMATMGGLVASGFSGCRRPWSGCLRDYLLGVKLLNGRGEVISFGGQVMKNVAGYDVSRLMAGAMGTLGVILEVSFKVLPKPAKEVTLSLNSTSEEAIRLMNEWSGQPLPLSGASFYQDTLSIRLSGAASEVDHSCQYFKQSHVSDNLDFWLALKEQTHPFFQDNINLWRLSVAPATAPMVLDGEQLIDWGGALRWLTSDSSASDIRQAMLPIKGHATLFRGEGNEKFQPLTAPLQKIHKNIKASFDPHHIFNIHRISQEW